MPAQTTIQIRRGSSGQWSSSISPLSQGELGLDTTINKIKIGDGTSLWSSLSWANITGADFVGSSGINISYNSASGIVNLSVTGLTSSYLSDFSSAVSGLLPVTNIVAGTNISVSGNNGTYTISTDGLDDNAVKDVIGTTISGVSGIAFSYDNVGKTATISLSDPTIQSTDVTDFNSAVSGLLPVTNITGSGDVSVASSGGSFTISSNIISFAPVNFSGSTDISRNLSVGTVNQQFGFRSSTDPWVENQYVSFYDNNSDLVYTGKLRIQYAGGFGWAFGLHNVSSIAGTQNGSTSSSWTMRLAPAPETFISSQITDFNTSVSGLLGVKSLIQSTGIGISNDGGIQTISVTGIPSSLITDFSSSVGSVVSTELVGGSGIGLSYNSESNSLIINTTGVSYVGHSHDWSNITDASSAASLAELTYLSGVIAGTAGVSRALVLDSNKDISGIRHLTSTGDVTVGGNLVIQGTTTTVNSTVVEIGDNIVRVNTSGLNTGGIEVYTGSDTKHLVWNTSDNRWEFSGGDVYTSDNFIGNASTVTNGVYVSDTGTVTSTMIANDTIVNADINSSAAISYSKLSLSNSIVDSDISSSAAISVNKLASSGITFGSTTANLGNSISSFVGLASISGTSSNSPTYLYNCVIDGGTP